MVRRCYKAVFRLTVLRPEMAPPRLTSPSIKRRLLAEQGVDDLVELAPEPPVLNMTAEHFWETLRDRVRPGNSDLCFEWKGPIGDAVDHLRRCKVAIERGPIERFGARGPGTSVYFRDPDGSLLEFISYGDR